MDARALGEVVRAAAARLGLAKVGAVPVEPPLRFDLYRSWLAEGHHGEMAYLAAPEHLAARADLRELLSGARTVLVAAMAYESAGPTGGIARYARGDDYHMVLRDALVALAEEVARAAGRPVASRVCVDSAPVMERELAERAGLGFVGKNTVMILPGLGSYVVLGELLLDVDLELADQAPSMRTRCGTCTACLDACPTQAFPGPHVLDARRCISYLTIETEGAIAPELRPRTGAWIFGCDVCQEVCPYNAAPPRAAPQLRPRDHAHATPDLVTLATAPSNQLKQFVKRTALRRIDRPRLLRNVCVALGNVGDARAVPALVDKLADASPLVRRHAAWALGAIAARHEDARAAVDAALAEALAREPDEAVRAEITSASTA
jgi:epoxyqueuosine reductase